MTTSIREQLDLKSLWLKIVHDVFDEFYPKQWGGTEERSIALAVQAALAMKMIPAIEQLISKLQQEDEIKKSNVYRFFAAAIYRLNNPESTMCIPNSVYASLDKKLSLLPTDRRITEAEALALVKGTPESLSQPQNKEELTKQEPKP